MSQKRNANLYALLSRRFAERPDAIAIETPDGKRLTYADVERESARFANRLLVLGARDGDRVVVQADKSPEALCLYLGCLRAGVIYLPLNTGYPARELEHFFRDAEPQVVVCRPQDLDMVADLARRCGVAKTVTLGDAGDGSLVESTDTGDHFDTIVSGEDDIAAILYTPGTTGRPKGATLSHRNLGSNAVTLHRVWGFCSSDVLLHALPLFHTHGLFVACHCSLLNATPMLLLPRFDAGEVSVSACRPSIPGAGKSTSPTWCWACSMSGWDALSAQPEGKCVNDVTGLKRKRCARPHEVRVKNKERSTCIRNGT